MLGLVQGESSMAPFQNRSQRTRSRSNWVAQTKPRVEILEQRTLLSLLLGEGSRRVARFDGASGDLVTLRLQGPGSAVVTLVGNATKHADLERLDLHGTDGSSRLTVRIRGHASRPRFTGTIEVGPGGLGALAVQGILAANVVSKGPLDSLKASAISGAFVGSTSGIGTIRVAGGVSASTIVAGLAMADSVGGSDQGVPGSATIGQVHIGGNLSNTIIAAGVAPGIDGRFGTADDIPASGTGPSTIGPVLVGGRIFAGNNPGAAVVISAANRTPQVDQRGIPFAGATGVHILGPIAAPPSGSPGSGTQNAPPSSTAPGTTLPNAPPPAAPPGATVPTTPPSSTAPGTVGLNSPPSAPPESGDPIDRSQLVNVSGQTQLQYSGIFNDVRTHLSTVNVQVTSTSATAIPTPLVLVIESISDPSVTVANADGIVTPDVHSFFDLTGQVPASTLDPGETTSNRPLVFNNPLLHTFTITTSVNYEITTAVTPTVTLSLPTDAQGRRLIGIADAAIPNAAPSGVVLTIGASGSAPMTVNLGQSAASSGSRGGVFYGASGTATSATVTTSGGATNVAQIVVRGDPAHPSAFQGDLNLTASVGGTQVATSHVTVFRIAPSAADVAEPTDAPAPVTMVTTPAIPNLPITFQGFRGTQVGNQFTAPFFSTQAAVNIIPGDGSTTVKTGADGTAQIELQQGIGGEGSTLLYGSDGSTPTTSGATFELTFTGGEDCGCLDTTPPPSLPAPGNGGAGGGGTVQPYSGETTLATTDLSIPGRGFDFQFTRTYRSQESQLRPVSTNDLGADWGFSYSDDFLLPDGNNVILFSPSMRTDTFMATATPGVYTAPIGFFQQLTVNGSGNFELRDSTGMVKTYESFSDPNIPGRLISEQDANGDLMTFHYAQIDPDDTVPGDQKSVLADVIDTLGREIRFQYYARTSQTVDGRVVTVTDPTGNTASFGRLAHVIDFKGDMTFDGSDSSADFPGQTNNRTLTFTYDQEGNLVSETSPAVTGTPDGNDFPNGKTTRYDYINEADIPASITGLDRARLLHGLIEVEAPNEAATDPGNTTGLANPFQTLTYGTNPADPATFDRVIADKIGGTNVNGVPAGGTVHYSYQIVATDARTTNDPYLQSTVTDGNGNVSQYVYSPYDTLLRQTVFTRGLRAGEPASYVTTYQYDNDKMLIKQIMPDGNSITYIHDHLNPDRLEQDNLLRTIQAPDAARDGDQTTITSATIYEPIYQHPAVVTDPRGLDPSFVPPVPDPSGRTQLQRYSTHYFFDYQESTEHAAQAPNDRIDKDGSGGRVNQSPLIAVDPTVLTTEVWLVQILMLPETAAGLATLRNRLAANGIHLGLGELNGDGSTTPAVAGNVVEMIQPSVVLLPASNQAGVEGSQLQPIVTLYRYNQFGQLTSEVDPEANVTQYTYFSEKDPDGDGVPTPPPADGRTLNTTTGGYLAATTVDTTSNPDRDSGTNPTPANIRTIYTYDDVGNITSMTDGRGIRTDYFVNELNQVVQTTSADAVPSSGPGNPSEPLPLTAFAYVQRVFFDYDNNVVISEVEDRGNTSNVDGNPPEADLPVGIPGASNPDPVGGTAFVDTVYKYDILEHPIEMVQEVSNGANPEFLVTRFRYDPNGNSVLTIEPEGNASSSFYDERNLLFQAASGATTPPSRALLAPGDPTSYDVRGGLAATMTYNYDANANLIETVDAEDTDGSPENNSKIAGSGDRTRYVYDGFDRQTAVIDSVGNETVYQYDPAGDLVRTTRFGPVGGTSPTADGPDVLPGPVSSLGVIQSNHLVNSNLLSATETTYDELMRAFQTAKVLFVNTIPTVRGPDVAEGGSDVGLGDLNPGQTQAIPGVSAVTILGRVADRTEYDRNSRVTFIVGDATETARTFYDGANRAIEAIDAEGNTAQNAYDGDSNLIETRQTDVSQVPGVAPEVFLTTNFYDSLNRLEQTVDNLGETIFYRYDSRGNLVAMADASGPAGPAIARRAYAGGALTVDTTNRFGNVTLYFYDGLDRQIRTEQILTASGQGDGVHMGASIEGVKNDPSVPESFPPAADPKQGGGDGIIRSGAIYDGNSLPSAMIDDSGNITLFTYDDLNRRVLQSEGLVVSSDYTEANILGPRVIPTPTAATINNPATIPNSKINSQLAETKTRIAAVASLFPSLAEQINDNPPTSTVWGFDPDGNILIMQDQNGSEKFVKYDAIDRPIAVRVFRVGQNDSFAGDPIFAPAPVSIPSVPGSTAVVPGTTIRNYQYDGLSRVVSATDNNAPTTADDDSTVTDAYDSLGRIIEEDQTIGAGPKQVTSSAFRADDLRSGLTYPDGRVEVYTYDHLDRLKTVADQGAALPIAVYEYIGVGRVLERLYPQNGTRETYLDDAGTTDIGYDGMRRPIEERDLESTGALIVGFTYTYERMGNKLTEGKLHDPANSETYTYDSAYRLTTFHRAPGGIAPSQTTWTLDGVGNPLQVNSQPQAFSSTNELIQSVPATGGPATVRYDNNGNQTDDGTNHYSYDAFNRLTEVTRDSDGAVIAIDTYDAYNRRISKVVTNSSAANGTSRFSYDGWHDIEERDGNGRLVQQYVFGAYIDEPLVLDRNLGGGATATGPGDQRLFYNQDGLFSVYALTDVTGKIIEAYQYDAYGAMTVLTGPGPDGTWFTGDEPRAAASAVANAYTFTGQRFDAESGLFYFKNRYYSALQGRFISRDPAVRGAEENTYEYASDNPINVFDPSGLDGEAPGGGLEAAVSAVKFVTGNNAAWDTAKALAAAGVSGTLPQGYSDPGDHEAETKKPKCESHVDAYDSPMWWYSARAGDVLVQFTLIMKHNGCDIIWAGLRVKTATVPWPLSLTVSGMFTPLEMVKEGNCGCCSKVAKSKAEIMMTPSILFVSGSTGTLKVTFDAEGDVKWADAPAGGDWSSSDQSHPKPPPPLMGPPAPPPEPPGPSMWRGD
jgi:RHS repeat-associated protein